MTRWLALAACVGLASPAFGQVREAISPSLSPEAARDAFEDAAVNGCIAAVGKGQRLSGAAFAASSDADLRAQIGAAADESVFDVVAGKGVVAVKEKEGRCAVSVYGPKASETVSAMARKLAAEHGFERLVGAPAPNGLSESLYKIDGGKRLQVSIRGSEPGMPNHKSRFSVVTLTVFATPAG